MGMERPGAAGLFPFSRKPRPLRLEDVRFLISGQIRYFCHLKEKRPLPMEGLRMQNHGNDCYQRQSEYHLNSFQSDKPAGGARILAAKKRLWEAKKDDSRGRPGNRNAGPRH
jgi:hypothetical protein